MRITHQRKLLRQADDLLAQAFAILTQQNAVIERLTQEKLDLELAHMRIGRDLIEQFLVALDQPENNDAYRRRLATSLGFYRDEIAVREEHV